MSSNDLAAQNETSEDTVVDANNESQPNSKDGYFIKIADGHDVFGPNMFSLKSKSSSTEESAESLHEVPIPKAMLADPGDSLPPKGYYKIIADDPICYLAPEEFVKRFIESKLTEYFNRSLPLQIPGLSSATLSFILAFYAMYEDKGNVEPSTGPTPEGHRADKQDSFMSDAAVAMYDRLNTEEVNDVIAAALRLGYRRLESLSKDYRDKKAKDDGKRN